MLKYSLIAFGLVAGLAFLTNNSKADPIVIKDIYTPVVQIDGQCSASIVKSEKVEDKVVTEVLTAKHCVKSPPHEGFVNIKTTDKGKIIEERNVAYDVVRTGWGNNDLALLRLRDTTSLYPVVKIADEIKVDIGDEVWVAGYPLGLIKTVTKGTFSGYHYIPMTKVALYQASAPVTFGNSGGALFQYNNGRYEQIGVTSMKVAENHFMNLFVPLEEVRYFLKLGRD